MKLNFCSLHLSLRKCFSPDQLQFHQCICFLGGGPALKRRVVLNAKYLQGKTQENAFVRV